jgi:hypothetical protein
MSDLLLDWSGSRLAIKRFKPLPLYVAIGTVGWIDHVEYLPRRLGCVA